MSVPDGHGVDRSWSGHCHHMAPAIAFSVSSILIGGSRLGSLDSIGTIWKLEGSTSYRSWSSNIGLGSMVVVGVGGLL